MLSLQRAEATLGKIVNNHEKHGREKRNVTNFAFPLGFRCRAEKLDEIARGLCASLFRKPEAGDQQELMGETEFTVVNCPDLKPSTLSQQYTGYEMTISPRGSESDDDSDALFLVDVKLSSFSVQPYEGGLCDVSFTATARIDLDTEAVPALRFSEVGEVLLTLTPPSRPTVEPDCDETE